MRRLIVGAVALGLLAFLLGRFGTPSFRTRWRNVKDGMTQREVTKLLGKPTMTWKTWTIGAGDQQITEWRYDQGRCTYCVDFDYVGPGGAPLVFRTERIQRDWEWPSWWPFAKARA